MAEYISRETMIKLLQSMADNAEANGFSYDREVIEAVRVTLAGIPAADVAQVVHGHWIRVKSYDPRDNFYKCSICRRSINVICGEHLSDYPYCHCGAKMDEEVNDT